MSQKKIIFFIIVGLIVVSMIAGILLLKNRTTTDTIIPGTLKIWITDGTTLGYDALTTGFHAYAPEYKNTNIVFEKKTTDAIRYRTLLLKTMADGTGPDIFMVGAGEDSVIESRIEPIPSDVLDFGDFEKRYDDIFLPLLVSSGTEDATTTTYLMGVPLGFETMGVFYNKTLIREVPRTWNDLDILYNKGTDSDTFVAGLGLGPRYTPNAADIIALFYGRDGTTDITGIKAGANNGLASYMGYRDIAIVGTTQDDAYAPIRTLVGEQADMETEKSTTLDLFMRGDIGMIYGYPSLITELEKSDKRAGISSKAGVILTEKIPALSAESGRAKNIAKFNFFALSKTTPNPEAGVKFLEYLMTSEAEKIFLQNNSYLISAQREFWTAQQGTKLSSILSRASMDAFIPDTTEELFVFSYGLKAEFENFLSEYIDRNDSIDINNISQRISHDLSCSIDTYSDAEIRPDCEKK